MASTLISGPAGAAKSQEARRRIEENPGLMIAADFQAIYAALTLGARDPVTGRYPARDERLLPLVEYVRRFVITAARRAGIDTVATNSDGSPARRELLLDELGPGAAEVVIDPGEETVTSRLRDPVTGEIEEECAGAIRRWYGRK